jgi:hypothetical protein
MASTTSNLALYKPTVGGDADAWGTQINANMDILDNAVTLAGTQTLTNKTINGSLNTVTNLSLTTAVTGTLPVANGGTGGTTHTANNVLLGNGTGAFQSVAPGTTGNVLTSNGTTWASTAPAGGGGSGTVTSVNVSGGSTGLSFSGGPITTTGTITASGTLAVANGGTGSSSLSGAGIVATTGDQSIAGTKTFTGLTRFTTASNGASFGQTTVNGNYALWAQPASASLGYAGIVTLNNSGNCGILSSTTSTGTALYEFYFGTFGSATPVGNISTNGSTTAYNTTSDYRLKENVNSLANSVTRLKQLAPKNFTWKNNPSLGSVEGFIAHELQAVIPSAVTGEKDAVDEQGNPKYQGIDTSMLIPLLTSALQEAFARIEALEAQA